MYKEANSKEHKDSHTCQTPRKCPVHPSDEAKSGNKVSSRITEGSKATLFDPQLLLKLGCIQVPSRRLGTTHYLNAVDARHSSE